MGTRIEVYRSIKVDGLQSQRTLLEEVEVGDKSGIYETSIGTLDVLYRTSAHGIDSVTLSGDVKALRMKGHQRKREIVLNELDGHVGRQNLRYNKEIVVFVGNASGSSER